MNIFFFWILKAWKLLQAERRWNRLRLSALLKRFYFQHLAWEWFGILKHFLVSFRKFLVWMFRILEGLLLFRIHFGVERVFEIGRRWCRFFRVWFLRFELKKFCWVWKILSNSVWKACNRLFAAEWFCGFWKRLKWEANRIFLHWRIKKVKNFFQEKNLEKFWGILKVRM